MAGINFIHRALTLALLGVLGGATHSALKPVLLHPAAPVPVPVTPPPGTANDPAAPTPPPVAGSMEVTLDQAKAMYESNVPFVDARPLAEYEAGHIDGAFWMSPDEFMSGKTPAALDYLVKDAPLVIYCGGGMCDASKNLAIFLQGMGYTQCRIFEAGYPGWTGAGLPTATGKPLIGGG